MSSIKVASGSIQQAWRKDYLVEYVRTAGFTNYMGTGTKSIIRLVNDLKSKAGDTVNIPLIQKLRGAGVTGNQVLAGNEDEMPQYNDQVKVIYRRNAVAITADETYKTDIDLNNAARDANVTWSAEKLRDLLIVAFQGVIVTSSADDEGFTVDTQKSLATATTGEKNAYLAANVDRIYAVGGLDSTTTWATAVAGVGTGDKLTVAGIRAIARKAKRTTEGAQAITPFKSDQTMGREYFVLFVDSNGFRDIQLDLDTINLDGRPRDVDSNPIFQSGDLLVDGVIIREIPEMDKAAANVGLAFLAGQSAIAVAYAQDPKPIQDERDFGRIHGVGIEEIYGTKKISYNGMQFGGVSVLHASVDDV